MIRITGLILFVVWALFSLMLSPLNTIPNIVPTLKKPTNWNEFGDALGSINGALSILSVLIAMHAISKQGKQINNSIKQQITSNEISMEALKEQINSNNILIKSITEQQKSNKINALSAAMSALAWDNDRLEDAIQNSKKSNNGKIDENNSRLIDNMNNIKTENLNKIKIIRKSIIDIGQNIS